MQVRSFASWQILSYINLKWDNQIVSPTIFYDGPYRFYFYASDRREPIHVHVGRDDKSAKIWLDSLVIAFNRQFSQKELRGILRIVARRRAEIEDRWHDFFAE